MNTSESFPRIYLENTQGSSSKFYRLQLLGRSDDQFDVLAQWGRIGADNPQSATKFTGSAEAAAAEMSALADKKRRGGYVDADDPGNAL